MADPITTKLQGATSAAQAEMEARRAALAGVEFSFAEDESDAGYNPFGADDDRAPNEKPNGDVRISVNTTRGITVWQRPDGTTYTEAIGGGTGGAAATGTGTGTTATGAKAAAAPKAATGAVTMAELEAGKATFPAPGIAQMGGYEYKRNVDGSWSVSRALASTAANNRSLTLNPKLTAAAKKASGSKTGYASPSGAENRAQFEVSPEWDAARAKGMEALVPIDFGVEGEDEGAKGYVNGAAGTAEVRFPNMQLGDQEVSMGQSFRTGDILGTYGIEKVSPEVDFANVLQLDRRRDELAAQGLQPAQYNDLIKAEMKAGTFASKPQEFATGGTFTVGGDDVTLARERVAPPTPEVNFNERWPGPSFTEQWGRAPRAAAVAPAAAASAAPAARAPNPNRFNDLSIAEERARFPEASHGGTYYSIRRNPVTGKNQMVVIDRIHHNILRWLGGGRSYLGALGGGGYYGGGGGGGDGGMGGGMDFGLSSPFSQDAYAGSPWGSFVSNSVGGASTGGGGRGRGGGGGRGHAQGGSEMIGNEPIRGVGDWTGETYFTAGEPNALTGRPTRERLSFTPLEQSVTFDQGQQQTFGASLQRPQATRNNELGLSDRGRRAVSVLSR